MQRDILHVLPGPRDFISYGHGYARLCWTGFVARHVFLGHSDFTCYGFMPV